MGSRIPTVVIVGGGASGSLTAIHLLSRPSTGPISLALVERDAAVGGGVAFSTESDRHLLNVPACGMSAFEGEPDHFLRWLVGNSRGYDRASYVPRRLYGRYLAETLCQHADLRGRRDEFETVRGNVVDLVVADGPYLVLAGGRRVRADAVVLATGLVAPKVPQFAKDIEASSRFVPDPWSDGALRKIEHDATVTLVGSGLTAIDVLLSLTEAGHHGAVNAVSRHGLSPRPHRAFLSRDDEASCRCARLTGTSTRQLLHAIREMVEECGSRGGDWRQVIDGLRPYTASLWLELPDVERRRFRRHLERYWSVHRHRMAPQIADTVDRLKRSGQFRVHAGHVLTIDEVPSTQGFEIRLGPGRTVRSLRSDWVINCSGPDPNVFAETDGLFSRLRAKQLAKPGPLGLGVATDMDGHVLNESGSPVEWLWTLGSLRQGDLLESTAVPELRQQASVISTGIRRFLSEGRQAREVHARDVNNETTRMVGEDAAKLERNYV